MHVDRLAIAALTAVALACQASDQDDVAETAPIVVAGDSASAPGSTPVDTSPERADTTGTLGYAATPRPVEVSLTMSNSGTYNGTYRASRIASVCGNPALGTAGKAQSFGVELPTQGDGDIVDLSFHADTLSPGGTTDMYYLSVTVRKRGATPPSFVLRTNEPVFNEKGKATLAVEGGTARLSITGKKELGETLEMSVVCKPT